MPEISTDPNPFEHFTPAGEHPLTALSSSGVIASIQLRRQFVDLRTTVGLTQKEVADQLGAHPSTIIRIEGGSTRLSVPDARELLRIYGVREDEEQEPIMQQVLAMKSSPVSSTYKKFASPAQQLLWDGEVRATAMRIFEPNFLPDFMQSASYADSMAKVFHDDQSEEQRITIETLRRQRAAYLLGKYGPSLHVIVDQDTVERPIGAENLPIDGKIDVLDNIVKNLQTINTVGLRKNGREVPDHLNPNITVQIVPRDIATYQNVNTEYRILDHPDLDGKPILYYKGGTKEVCKLDSGVLAVKYGTDFQNLARKIPPPGETNDLLDAMHEAEFYYMLE